MAKNVLSRIMVRGESRTTKHVEIPTSATLDKFEQESGLKLPDTYREFAVTFGAGELAGFYRIYTPLPKSYRFQGQAVYDLAAENERLRPHLASFVCPNGTADYWVFCIDAGGIMYAWNANEPQRKGHDYRIYEVIHDDEVRLAAETFLEFVTHCCQLDYWQDEDEKEAPRWTFAQFPVPPR